MDCNNVIRLMKQQLDALKPIEELLDHNTKQEQTHGISAAEIEALKTYISNMKLAATTATALAEHYKPAPAATAKPAVPEKAENAEAEKTEPEEKPKRRRSTAKKAEAEPVTQEPEQPAPEPVAKPEQPTPIVPVAEPVEQQPAAPVDINALIAAISIDNLSD